MRSIEINGSRIIEVRPPRIAQLLVLIAFVTHWFFPVSARLYSNATLGVIGIVGGLSLMLVAWRQFKKRDTAVCPTDTPSSLVTDGVFRVSRNPMYLGILITLVGFALIAGSIPFYLAVIAWFVVMDRAFCPYEEEKLTDLFADRYVDYCDRVRRWF